ncbi:uncharacterized protein LOC113651658 isoform X1 [Tachysurus ichikawai]
MDSAHRSAFPSASGGQQRPKQLPPVCKCQETVKETLDELLPVAVKQAVEAAQPPAGTPGAPEGNKVSPSLPH